jgi:hypothetical protein
MSEPPRSREEVPPQVLPVPAAPALGPHSEPAEWHSRPVHREEWAGVLPLDAAVLPVDSGLLPLVVVAARSIEHPG